MSRLSINSSHFLLFAVITARAFNQTEHEAGTQKFAHFGQMPGVGSRDGPHRSETVTYEPSSTPPEALNGLKSQMHLGDLSFRFANLVEIRK